jgi:hypothetical protein
MTTMRFGWRDDKPPVGVLVEVWYLSAVCLATWTGKAWLAQDGTAMAYVTHWRTQA